MRYRNLVKLVVSRVLIPETLKTAGSQCSTVCRVVEDHHHLINLGCQALLFVSSPRQYEYTLKHFKALDDSVNYATTLPNYACHI